jgi:hypothetical protein
MEIHYSILDAERIDILPLLTPFKELGFYLAGGTALALQIGHRDSIDFDFFCPQPFDTLTLFSTFENIFSGHTLLKTQEELNTLEVTVDEKIKLSFMTYKYPLIAPVVPTDFFDLAFITDIGCMKLSAITSRTAYKDYVDLYFILKQVPLDSLMQSLKLKLPTLDPILTLKSLVYFDDITPEEILYKVTPLDFAELKASLEQSVLTYSNRN